MLTPDSIRMGGVVPPTMKNSLPLQEGSPQSTSTRNSTYDPGFPFIGPLPSGALQRAHKHMREYSAAAWLDRLG